MDVLKREQANKALRATSKALGATFYFREICKLNCSQTIGWTGRIEGRGFSLSFSYPPDCPWAIVTKLIRDDNIVYEEKLGYDNVCYFDTLEEVVEEFLRLQDALANADADDVPSPSVSRTRPT